MNETIPRILHRCVPDVVPERFQQFWEGWLQLHPSWTPKSWQDPIDPQEFPLTAHAWPAVDSGAALAGLVRLEAVYTYGGIFLDWDVRPVGRILDSLLLVDGGMFAAWEDGQHIPDAVFGAAPGHPAVAECLERALRATAQGAGAWAASVGVFTAVLPGRDDVTLLPSSSFYPRHYTDRAAARAYEPQQGDGVYGVHEYAWSWNADPEWTVEP